MKKIITFIVIFVLAGQAFAAQKPEDVKAQAISNIQAMEQVLDEYNKKTPEVLEILYRIHRGQYMGVSGVDYTSVVLEKSRDAIGEVRSLEWRIKKAAESNPEVAQAFKASDVHWKLEQAIEKYKMVEQFASDIFGTVRY